VVVAGYKISRANGSGRLNPAVQVVLVLYRIENQQCKGLWQNIKHILCYQIFHACIHAANDEQKHIVDTSICKQNTKITFSTWVLQTQIYVSKIINSKKKEKRNKRKNTCSMSAMLVHLCLTLLA
jgi:hypothetical protein